MRLDNKDTMMDVMTKMSEGNPGALSFLMSVFTEDPMIFMPMILSLDALEVYGSKIYMLWSDACNKDLKKVLEVLEAWRSGKLSTLAIKNNLSKGRAEPFDLKECALCNSDEPSPFKEGCHNFNVNMENQVMINFIYLDKHIAPEETMPLYARLRNEGKILFDIRIGKYNRVMGIQLEDTYWYLSAGADKNDLKQEELFFWEQEDRKDLQESIQYVLDTAENVKVIVNEPTT